MAPDRQFSPYLACDLALARISFRTPIRALPLVASMATSSRVARAPPVSMATEDESDLTPLEDELAVAQTQRGGTKRSRSKRTTSQSTVAGSEELPKKRKRARKPEPVYVIPDVEKKETTFRGRLGTSFVCSGPFHNHFL